jgi:hypothetical protein
MKSLSCSAADRKAFFLKRGIYKIGGQALLLENNS